MTLRHLVDLRKEKVGKNGAGVRRDGKKGEGRKMGEDKHGKGEMGRIW